MFFSSAVKVFSRLRTPSHLRATGLRSQGRPGTKLRDTTLIWTVHPNLKQAKSLAETNLCKRQAHHGQNTKTGATVDPNHRDKKSEAVQKPYRSTIKGLPTTLSSFSLLLHQFSESRSGFRPITDNSDRRDRTRLER